GRVHRPALGADERGGDQLLPGARHSCTTVPSSSQAVSGRSPSGVHSAATVTGRPPETASSRQGTPADGWSGRALPSSSSRRPSAAGTTPASTTGQESVHGSAASTSAISPGSRVSPIPGGGPAAARPYRSATRARSGAEPG